MGYNQHHPLEPTEPFPAGEDPAHLMNATEIKDPPSMATQVLSPLDNPQFALNGTGMYALFATASSCTSAPTVY